MYDECRRRKVIMDDEDLLAKRFEKHRVHLRGVAYRMLGSLSEADDAIQEAWLRLSRSEANTITNFGGWLTTVTARVCLDMLRTRKACPEGLQGAYVPEIVAPGPNPEQERVLADSVGLALLVVLETLTPAERLAYVLHDMFAMPFEEIAAIVGRSVAAAKQLASRARRRIQGAPAVPEAELKRQRQTVEAFLAAARGGDLNALLEVLDPNVVARADFMTVRGAADVGRQALIFSRRFIQFARPALVNGAVGLVVAPKGRLMTVLAFDIVNEKIVEVRTLVIPLVSTSSIWPCLMFPELWTRRRAVSRPER
jgi:RNA polymerase sigma factor (sigma-70 family)